MENGKMNREDCKKCKIGAYCKIEAHQKCKCGKLGSYMCDSCMNKYDSEMADRRCYSTKGERLQRKVCPSCGNQYLIEYKFAGVMLGYACAWQDCSKEFDKGMGIKKIDIVDILSIAKDKEIIPKDVVEIKDNNFVAGLKNFLATKGMTIEDLKK